MTHVYYIDGKKFTTNNYGDIPRYEISSPNEETPAYEDTIAGYKEWHEKDWIIHRLTGPARIWPDGKEDFYLNDKRYENVKEWLKDHPNPDLYFDALGMNETDKVLWYLKN
jgi:hypothetical protein